jgi:hypothetical protein
VNRARSGHVARVRIGPPLDVTSRELQVRTGTGRVLIRFEFRFGQDGQPLYFGDQTAMFVRESVPGP